MKRVPQPENVPLSIGCQGVIYGVLHRVNRVCNCFLKYLLVFLNTVFLFVSECNGCLEEQSDVVLQFFIQCSLQG